MDVNARPALPAQNKTTPNQAHRRNGVSRMENRIDAARRRDVQAAPVAGPCPPVFALPHEFYMRLPPTARRFLACSIQYLNADTGAQPAPPVAGRAPAPRQPLADAAVHPRR